MIKKNQHNKKRNTGLLYEFLTRHVSTCIVEDKNDEAKKAVSILKKYFSVGSFLHEELKLYKTLLNTQLKSKDYATKLLSEVYTKHSKSVNYGKIEEEKSKLIKEINYNFDSNKIYECKVPNYPVYASIYLLFANNRKGKNKLLESIDKLKLEDSIINFLSGGNKKEIFNEIKTNPTYSNAVYKVMMSKFNERYSKHLNEGQKKLVNKYVMSLVSEDSNEFSKVLKEEVNSVKNCLRTIRDPGINKDADLSKKLNECYKRIVSTNYDNLDDDKLVELLEYMSLIEEIKGE